MDSLHVLWSSIDSSDGEAVITLSEVKDSFKALDRNTRIVILHLRQEINELRETRYEISEQEKNQIFSRVETVKKELLLKIGDVANQMEPLRENLRGIRTSLGEIVSDTREMNREMAARRAGKPEPLDAGISFEKKKLRESPRFRKILAGLPDDILPVALLEAYPKLIAAAKEDIQEEPRDWTTLKRILEVMSIQIESDETLVEMVKVKRAEFEGWSP